MLLVDERFRDEDPGFLDQLFLCSGSALKGFATRWAKDPRRFARRTLLRYIDDGCDRPGHRPLVKKLFKDAEDREDDELMRHFMVAFDRMISTQQFEIQRWDNEAQSLRPATIRLRVDDQPPTDRFSTRTRRYLQRRAYRYFRHIGYRDPARYVTNLLAALRLYADEDTIPAERQLDRWGLFHALYWGAPEGWRRTSGIMLTPGHRIQDLPPAPRFADEWRRQTHVNELLALAGEGRNADVRVWVRAWLQSDPAQPLAEPRLAQVWPLLRSPYIDAQEWSAELLPSVTDLSIQPIRTWVELMTLPNDPAAPAVASLASAMVAPERLSLDVAVQVVLSAAGPVADVVLDWIRMREVTKADLPILIRLANTKTPQARAAAVAWLTGLLGKLRSVLLTRELLDSAHIDVRARALELIQTHYVGEIPLAVALFESPFTDVRDALVRHLEDWSVKLPPQKVQHIWARTLLSVRNGGRAKQAALRQLATVTLDQPDLRSRREALPLLAIALRSVRERERRSALVAVARIVHARPELAADVARAIPELTLPSTLTSSIERPSQETAP